MTKTTTKKSMKNPPTKVEKKVSTKVEKSAEETPKKKRVTDTVGAKAKAKKIIPGNVNDIVKSVVDICVHAYDIQKPKEKEIEVASKISKNVDIIPITIPCNWGKFLHKAQIELYLKHFASKLGYIETGFYMDEKMIKFHLIGPFETELLQESF